MRVDLATDPEEQRNRCDENAQACRLLEESARERERGLHPRTPGYQRTGERLFRTEIGDPNAAELSPAEQEKLQAFENAE